MRGLSFVIKFKATVESPTLTTQQVTDKINRLITHSTLKDVFSEVGIDLYAAKVVDADLDDEGA